MDLSGFATKKNADEGRWFPMKWKGTKYPISLLIYGDDSDVVSDYNSKKLRKMKFENGSLDTESLEDLLDSKDEGIIVRIGDVSAYDWDKGEKTKEELVLYGRKITSDKKDIAYLIEQIPDVKDFVKETSNERKNFL